MSISVTDTLSDSVDRMLSVSGAGLFVGILGVRLANGVVSNTLFSELVTFAIGRTRYTVSDLERELLERGLTPAVVMLREIQSTGLDVGLPVAVALVLVVPLVAEFVRVVGVRALAAEPSDGVPTDEILGGLAGAYVRSLLAGIIAAVLVLVGTVLLVLPGLVLAILFMFIRQSVVLDDKGAFAALSHSVGLVKRNLLPMLALAVLIVVLFPASWFVAGTVPVGVLSTAITTLFAVFFVSLVTSAYVQASTPV
jgi:hypothetical protein